MRIAKSFISLLRFVWLVCRGDDMFFVVPLSGGGLLFLLWFLFCISFPWVALPLSVISVLLFLVYWKVGEWWAVKAWHRHRAEQERKRDPVCAAVNDYLETCDAIDRGF